MVEKFPTVLEKLSQNLRGDFFDSHCRPRRDQDTEVMRPRRL